MEYILIALLTRYTYDGIGAISQEFNNKQMCVAAGDILMHKHKSSVLKQPKSYYICVPKGRLSDETDNN